MKTETAEPTGGGSYDRTDLTRLRRRHLNASYDRDIVHAILDSALICHVGYVVDGQPVVTPTAYWRVGEHLYFHGSAASRTLEHMAEGVQVCVTVSHLDGIVHARSGFNSCMNYRAVMCFGQAEAVTDPGEKARCLDDLLDRLAPGRSRESRPSTAQELKGTKVLRLVLDQVSAKVRAGDVGDDEVERASDYWAGIVPVRMVVDEPIDDPELRPGIPRPHNVSQLRLGR